MYQKCLGFRDHCCKFILVTIKFLPPSWRKRKRFPSVQRTPKFSWAWPLTNLKNFDGIRAMIQPCLHFEITWRDVPASACMTVRLSRQVPRVVFKSRSQTAANAVQALLQDHMAPKAKACQGSLPFDGQVLDSAHVSRKGWLDQCNLFGQGETVPCVEVLGRNGHTFVHFPISFCVDMQDTGNQIWCSNLLIDNGATIGESMWLRMTSKKLRTGCHSYVVLQGNLRILCADRKINNEVWDICLENAMG